MTNPSFSPDIPAKIDLLKRKPFASSLAKSLCLDKDTSGLVVGIEGDWGSGKSSIINFIKEELEASNSKPIIIEFNPWMTSGSKDLVEIMLTQLASMLGTNIDSDDGINVAEKIIQYANLLKYLKYLPTVNWLGNIVEDATNAATDGLNDIKKLITNIDISKSKHAVEKSLRTLNKPVVVIIDDLDRLTHSEVMHLFQAIKSVADFPRVAYLLAYDFKQISLALDKEFGQNKGQDYLEKIIQISYPIPIIMPLQMMAFTQEKLENLLSRLSITLKPYEKKYWDRILSILVGIQKTPRDSIRLINRLVIAIPNTKSEINVCDVIVLEAISLKFPSIRTILHQNPELFTGRFWITDEDGTNYDWSQYLGEEKDKSKQKWMEKLPNDENDKKSLSRALKFLFPHLIDNSSDQNLVDELRVTATDRLQRYFALTALEGSVDVGLIHKLLQNPELLESCLSYDLDTVFQQLSDIDCYIGSAEIKDFDSISKIFMNYAKNLTFRPSQKLIVNILIKLIAKQSEDKKVGLFNKIIVDLPLSVNTDVLLLAVSNLDLWPNKRGHKTNNPLIENKEAVQSEIRTWQGRVETEARHAKFLEYHNARSIVWCWWHLGGDKELIRSIVKDFFTNQSTVQLAIERFLDKNGYMEIESYELIWDPIELEKILREVPGFIDEYSDFIKQLKLPDVIQWFQKRQETARIVKHMLSKTDPDFIE